MTRWRRFPYSPRHPASIDQLKISRFIRRVTGLDEFVNGQQLGFQLLIGDFGRVNGRLFDSLFFNRRSIQIDPCFPAPSISGSERRVTGVAMLLRG